MDKTARHDKMSSAFRETSDRLHSSPDHAAGGRRQVTRRRTRGGSRVGHQTSTEKAPRFIGGDRYSLVLGLGLHVPPGTAPPRAHDLRHSFAVGTLLRWYRAGRDPAARLLRLSTFLGHVDPASTAVDLTITQELLQEANRRFEDDARPALEEPTP